MSRAPQSPLDTLVTGFDRTLRRLTGDSGESTRPLPDAADAELTAEERREAVRLMRVNHAGEVSAQALYHGQSVAARSNETREHLRRAAEEESDHLAWCRTRLRELDGRESLLNPLWYAGSFAIGALAGLAGDRVSLGFISETERQVVEHLDGHLERLPAADRRSRAILAAMRDDEARHGDEAQIAGGDALPTPVRRLMRGVSRIMTRTAYWV